MIISVDLDHRTFIRRVAKRLTGKKLGVITWDKFGIVRLGGGWRALMRFSDTTNTFRGLSLLKVGVTNPDLRTVERALVVMIGEGVDYRDHPDE